VTDESSFPIGSPTRVGLDATTPRIADESTPLALQNFTYVLFQTYSHRNKTISNM
jgi:hypothetical protein